MNHGVSPSLPRILVVDDDALVRDMLVDMLGEAGFEATPAACAEEALDGLAHNPEFAAVVSDIDMPGEIDGIGLAERIGAYWPRVGVILISGRGRMMRALPPGADFIAKPFTTERLVRAVGDLISGCLPACVGS